MMDDAISNAMRRRAEILRELEEIDVFIKLHSKFSGSRVPPVVPKTSQDVNLSKSDYEGALARGATYVGPLDELPRRQRGRPSDFADLMEGILRVVRRPLSRPEFVAEFKRRSIDIPSDDEQRYLGTILWRNRGRFRNIPKFGYWLIGEPYEPADYDPAKDTESQRALDAEADLIGPMPGEPDEGEI